MSDLPESPEWLGLPNNADKVLLTIGGSDIVAKLLKMQLLEDKKVALQAEVATFSERLAAPLLQSAPVMNVSVLKVKNATALARWHKLGIVNKATHELKNKLECNLKKRISELYHEVNELNLAPLHCEKEKKSCPLYCFFKREIDEMEQLLQTVKCELLGLIRIFKVLLLLFH